MAKAATTLVIEGNGALANLLAVVLRSLGVPIRWSGQWQSGWAPAIPRALFDDLDQTTQQTISDAVEIMPALASTFGNESFYFAEPGGKAVSLGGPRMRWTQAPAVQCRWQIEREIEYASTIQLGTYWLQGIDEIRVVNDVGLKDIRTVDEIPVIRRQLFTDCNQGIRGRIWTIDGRAAYQRGSAFYDEIPRRLTAQKQR